MSESPPPPTDAEYAAMLHLARLDKVPESDQENAELFFLRFGGDLLIDSDRGEFLVWDGTRFRRDPHRLRLQFLAQQHALAVMASGRHYDDKDARWKLALRFQTNAAMQSSMNGIRSKVRRVTADELDANPMLFNVRNGTIDLRWKDDRGNVIADSDRLRPHRREDLITMLSDLEYDPGAKCPRYDDFLLKICCNDTTLVDFLDRIDGYCLTGEVREELGFIEDGEGSNGKTTRSNIQRKLGGDYAGVTNANNLIAKQFDGHPTVLAVLERLRRVTAEEFPDGGRLDMARWKKLVNRGRLPAHRMHEDERDFELTFKINLEVNTLPRIDEIDTGSWRRICVLPFRLDLRKEGLVNTKIEDELVAELPGILARTVRGCVAWQQRGLAVDVPACVVTATAVYRTDEDLLAGFIADYCDCGLEYDEAAAALYRAFKDWSKQNGVVNPWSKKKFGQRLKARFEPTTDGEARKWKGLRLKPATVTAIEERQIAGTP